ncbi:acyl-CoA dehydrogenase [Klebsiella pneumoniae]|nr:acyl-CoA dehydrogenase [Klebsiella pneumoniae]
MLRQLAGVVVDDFAPEELATKPVKLPEKVRKVEAA